MKPILEIRNLSKVYKLGAQRGIKIDNAREALVRGLWSVAGLLKRNKDTKLATSNGFFALKDVSFDVNEGDVLGIIGRNGAGKSTLLKILSRITQPTDGYVKVRGRLSSLLEVGTGFHPELTGRENIFLNGAILGMKNAEIQKHFDEIVAFAEVDKFLDTPVKRYSSGMYMRLAFAVAAHLTPEILVVDEVLAVGDLAFQKKCLGKMGEVSRGGRTILFVSHNMAAIENLCSRGVVLQEGQLQFNGTAKDALQFYLSSLSTRSGKGNVVELDSVGTRRVVVAPLLRRMEFLRANDEPLNEGVPIGGTLKIKVQFELPNPTDTVNIGLGFDNNHGHRIFTAYSAFQPDRKIVTRVGLQEFTCTIPKFTVTPGEYGVKVWLDLKRVQADAIEDAARIRVLEADYYGTGRVPWNGTCVMPHDWNFS